MALPANVGSGLITGRLIRADAVAYQAGDLVTFAGLTYRCITAHTSQAGWTPDVVPALWTLN